MIRIPRVHPIPLVTALLAMTLAVRFLREQNDPTSKIVILVFGVSIFLMSMVFEALRLSGEDYEMESEGEWEDE